MNRVSEINKVESWLSVTKKKSEQNLEEPNFRSLFNIVF